jgi:hypothetical protein
LTSIKKDSDEVSRVFNLSGVVARKSSGCHIGLKEAENDGDMMATGNTEDEIRRDRHWGIRRTDCCVRGMTASLPGGGKLWATVASGEPPGSIRFTLSARPGHAACEVRQSVYARRVTLAGGGIALASLALFAAAGEKPRTGFPSS